MQWKALRWRLVLCQARIDGGEDVKTMLEMMAVAMAMAMMVCVPCES